jgi:DNA repair photolyase
MSSERKGWGEGRPGGGDRTRGRGAASNPANRFHARHVEPFDDGWGGADEPLPVLRTVVTPDPTRTILASNDSPDIPFDRSINPYRGCEHGCIYCFARPSHAYLDLSPGLDFETRILAKPRAAELLRRELGRPGYRCEPIALGTNTDPYQPAERALGITRSILQVLAEHAHPFSIVTKSSLVLRDLDVIAPMAAAGRALVFVSVTTLDRALARRMEPRAAAPGRRLEAVHELAAAGVPTGVLASPMIPGINDAELEAILEQAARAGARQAGYLLVRLPHELEELFTDWLERHYPARKDKVLHRIREMRGGRLNDPRFGRRMRGEGPHAVLLRRRFEIACRRLGLERERPRLDVTGFRVPGRPEQGKLFA